MILNTDSCFFIGSLHKTCQDFAISEIKSLAIENDTAISIVSDGCSGSKNTCFGSRIISKCAENRIKYYLPEENSFRNKLLLAIDDARDTLYLNPESLDATLLFIQSTFTDYEVRVYGDGAILKLKYNGDIEFTLIEYPSGAPLYLNYYLDNRRFDRYKEQYGLQRKIFKYIIKSNELSRSETTIDHTGLPYIEDGSNDDYKAIVVTSDGISSFVKSINKTKELVDPVIIAKAIMDFKSVKGEFIQRRMNGFKYYCDINSIKHTDDFSVAGISFEK